MNHDSVAAGLSPTGGKGGTLRDIAAAHDAFPDLDITVADVFGGSGKVAARVIVRGTHLGELPGIAPTGKRTAVMGQEIWRVAGSRIIEHWGRFVLRSSTYSNNSASPTREDLRPRATEVVRKNRRRYEFRLGRLVRGL